MQNSMKLLLFTMVALLAIILSACATPAAPAVEEPAAEAPAAEEPAAEPTEAPAEEPAGEVIELQFWHAMGGNLGELVNELERSFRIDDRASNI